jgi:hypothetical protein
MLFLLTVFTKASFLENFSSSKFRLIATTGFMFANIAGILPRCTSSIAPLIVPQFW